MKRTLILAAALYLLHDRQRRVERRQLAWKTRRDAELREWAAQFGKDVEAFTEANRRWGSGLVREIEKAFKAVAR